MCACSVDLHIDSYLELEHTGILYLFRFWGHIHIILDSCTLSVMFWSRFESPCQRTLPQLPNILFICCSCEIRCAACFYTSSVSFLPAPCNHLCITPAHRVELISPVIIVIIDHRGRIGKVRQGFRPVCTLKTD